MRAATLLRSLHRAGVLEVFRNVFVVVPAADLKAASRLVAPYSGGNVVTLAEDEVVPQLAAFSGRYGYRKQQLIKVGISAHQDVEFTLTLDSDVYCCHPFDESDLVIGGRALTQYEPRSLHLPWWTASAALLRTEPDRSPLGISVTPAILSRTICRRLIEDLTSIHGLDAFDLLLTKASARWTEYSLYHLCAEKYDLIDRYHLPPSERGHPRLICDGSLWFRKAAGTWYPEECFADRNHGFFIVCQSNTDISPLRAARILDELDGRRRARMSSLTGDG